MTLEIADAGRKYVEEAIRLARCAQKQDDAGKPVSAKQFNFQAIIEFTKAIKISPKENRYYLVRSQCYAKTGQYQKALDDATTALDLNPAELQGYCRKGEALVGLKQFDEAELCFLRMLERDPECEDAMQELKKISLYRLVDHGYTKEECVEALEENSNIFEDALEFLESKSTPTSAPQRKATEAAHKPTGLSTLLDRASIAHQSKPSSQLEYQQTLYSMQQRQMLEQAGYFQNPTQMLNFMQMNQQSLNQLMIGNVYGQGDVSSLSSDAAGMTSQMPRSYMSPRLTSFSSTMPSTLKSLAMLPLPTFGSGRSLSVDVPGNTADILEGLKPVSDPFSRSARATPTPGLLREKSITPPGLEADSKVKTDMAALGSAPNISRITSGGPEQDVPAKKFETADPAEKLETADSNTQNVTTAVVSGGTTASTLKFSLPDKTPGSKTAVVTATQNGTKQVEPPRATPSPGQSTEAPKKEASKANVWGAPSAPFKVEPVKSAASRTKEDVEVMKTAVKAEPVKSTGTTNGNGVMKKESVKSTETANGQAEVESEEEDWGATTPAQPSHERAYLTDPANPKKLTTIFVGNLDHLDHGSEQVLQKMFHNCGPITSVYIAPGKHFGFVNFQSHESASTAMKTMKGYKNPYGQVIKLMYQDPDYGKKTDAIPSAPKAQTNGNIARSATPITGSSSSVQKPPPAIWIGNLYIEDDEDLVDMFKTFGPIQSRKYMEEKSCGIVEFTDHLSAKKAMETMNKKFVNGARIEIRYREAKECQHWRKGSCPRNPCNFRHDPKNKGIDASK